MLSEKDVIVQISPINSRELKLLHLNRLLIALSNDPDLANVAIDSHSKVLQTLFVVSGCDYTSFLVALEKQHFYAAFFNMQNS